MTEGCGEDREGTKYVTKSESETGFVHWIYLRLEKKVGPRILLFVHKNGPQISARKDPAEAVTGLSSNVVSRTGRVAKD